MKTSIYNILAALLGLALLTIVILAFGTRKSSTPITPDTGTSTESEQDDDADTQTGVTALPELDAPISSTHFLLNTLVQIKLYDRGDQALIQECFELIQEYESKLSRTISTSEISQLNAAQGRTVTVSEETAHLLELALHYSELSGGAFDLTIAPVSSIWNFTSEPPVRPTDAAILEALPHVDYHNVQIQGTQVTLTDPEAAIDLGAIAKGYIADRVKDLLLSRGVKSAIINLGGNVLCVGSKPDGSGYNVGIQKPFEGYSETIATLELHDLSVVSSGIYERCFREGDQFYHHILNPDTGYPVENNLISVTILSKCSADGDGLSTTCFSLGLEKGMELIDSLPDTWAVFITEDYELHYSEGFEENIKILE